MGTVILADVTELETVKISELPVTAAVGDAAALPIVSIGKTKKIAKSNLLKNLNIPLDNVLHVAKNGNDGNAGTIGDPLLTIQAAIDFAVAHLPAAPNVILIMVYPGTYEEQITDTHSRVYIEGAVFTSATTKSAIIYMSGIDAAHYPLAYTGGETLNIANISVKVDDGNVYGKFLNLRADRTSFLGGYFIEYTGSGFRKMEFRFSQIYGKAFDLTGNTDGRVVTMLLGGLLGSPVFDSTSSTGPMVLMMMVGSCYANLSIKGNWFLDCYLVSFLEGYSLSVDTIGGIKLKSCELPNGLHFVTNPSGAKTIEHCSFLNSAAASDHKDISADAVITEVAYYGNVQQNGICDCIQIISTEKKVGAGANDRYFDLQSAVSSIPAGSEGTVKIFENLSGLAELTLPNENVNITINGQKQYSLSFTGDIVEIGTNRKVRFADIAQLAGGNVELNGVNSELSLESCQYVTGYITLTVGAFAIMYKSSLFGSTGKAALYIDNTDTIVVVGYSRVQGSTGQPAVEFSVDADNKFKAKYSSFIHGDKDASEPIVNLAAGKVDFSIYLCGLNAPWNAAKFTNLIGSAGNATDVNINF